MLSWTPGRFWNHTVKAQRPEIQLIDKHVDHPHRVGLMANTAANSVLAADDEPSLRHWFAKKDLPEKC